MKEKLKIEHLAPYLPYGLKCKVKDGMVTMTTLNNYVMNGDHEESYGYEDHPNEKTEFKPILRPMTDLTKEIEIGGEKIITIEKLRELFLETVEYKDGDTSLSRTLIYDDGFKVHSQDYHYSCDGIEEGYEDVSDFEIYQKLFEWHFDVFGLIEKGLAVDINTFKI